MKKLIFILIVLTIILCGCSEAENNNDGAVKVETENNNNNFAKVVVTNDTPLFDFAGKTFDEVKAYFGEPDFFSETEKEGNSMGYQKETHDIYIYSEYESRDKADAIILNINSSTAAFKITEKCHTQMNLEEANKTFEEEGYTCTVDDLDASQTVLIAQNEKGKIECIWASYATSGMDITKYPDSVIIYDEKVMDYYS